MKRFFLIIMWIGLLTLEAEAQELWIISGKSISELRQDTAYHDYQRPSKVYTGSLRLKTKPHDQAIPKDITKVEVPRAYSYEHLGMFCKWEVQIERAVGLPVKFRLGEVQYVERMEGKQ